MERLRGVALLDGCFFLEEVCHGGWAFKFQKPMSGPLSFSLPVA